MNLVLSKGCTEAKDQEPRVTWHRAGPGLTVVSYTRVCRHGDFCNDVSNTRTFWTPPASPDARGRAWHVKRKAKAKGLAGSVWVPY